MQALPKKTGGHVLMVKFDIMGIFEPNNLCQEFYLDRYVELHILDEFEPCIGVHTELLYRVDKMFELSCLLVWGFHEILSCRSSVSLIHRRWKLLQSGVQGQYGLLEQIRGAAKEGLIYEDLLLLSGRQIW
jgi:hypothetical protein